MIPTTLRVPISSANMALDCVRVTGVFLLVQTQFLFFSSQKKASFQGINMEQKPFFLKERLFLNDKILG